VEYGLPGGFVYVDSDVVTVNWMKKEIADMYRREGPLMLDPNAYKIYRARQFKIYFDEFRPYYCFQSDSHNNGRQVDHHE